MGCIYVFINLYIYMCGHVYYNKIKETMNVKESKLG